MAPAKPGKKISWLNLAWEVFCVASVLGIWPRHIERRLQSISRHHLCLKEWPRGECPLHIVQLSDLHLRPHCSDRFLKRLLKRLEKLRPDILVLTGDLLCYSQMKERERLEAFLRLLPSRLGTYSILGNHDYSDYVSVNSAGDYDVVQSGRGSLSGGFRRLLRPKVPTGRVTERAHAVQPHPELSELLDRSGVRLLHNETVQVGPINLCGLGDYWAGKCLPKQAFQDYTPDKPGIILSHNPDSIRLLKDYPGDLILSGHTHGGQVNLPVICPRVMAAENPHLKRGFARQNEKLIYINRGIGTVIPFRCFSIPEILSLTLSGAP